MKLNNQSVNSFSDHRHQWIVASHLLLPNGPAHRLFNFLETKHESVGFCGVPFPGAFINRMEFSFPLSSGENIFLNVKKRASYFLFIKNLFYIYKYAIKLKKKSGFAYNVVCCDPLIFLEIKFIFKIANVRTASITLWFVDWSAQRLDSIISGFIYRLLTKLSGRFSTIIAGISESATAEISNVIKNDSVIFFTIPNIPLSFNKNMILDWANREAAVVSMSGLLKEQGTEFLNVLSELLCEVGIELIIIGDGPLADEMKFLDNSRENVTYLGLIESVDELVHYVGKAKIGLALYDPNFSMYSFNDPLKIKDYLSAGLKVVSTLPRSFQDESIYVSSYDAQSIYESIISAINSDENPDANKHPLLIDSIKAVEAFIEKIENSSQ